MADLKTTYMGLELSSPIIVGSGPLTATVDRLKECEDAGAGAVVVKSIFEEQIRSDVSSMYDDLSDADNSAAYDYLRADLPMQLGPERYLERIAELKQSVDIPVIASINCIAADQWLAYARKIETTGVDALELNVYDISDAPGQTASELEERHVELVRSVRKQVSLPIAVKIGPYYSAMINFTSRLEQAGANGIVLFNRFMQPDINTETLKLENTVNFSRPDDIRLPMRWTAILRGQLACSLSLTSGVHSAEGAAKAILAGADTVQMCSSLMQNGISRITEVNRGIKSWMEQQGADELSELRGKLQERDLTDRAGFERAQYVTTLAGMEPY